MKKELIRLEFMGRNLTISEWSKVTGIPTQTIRHRLNGGWTVASVLQTPVHDHKYDAIKTKRYDIICRENKKMKEAEKARAAV